MSFDKPYYFVAMVFSPLWEGPKWLEVALDNNFASVRLDADQSKRFSLSQMQLTVAHDQQKTWYLAWRDDQGKWAIGIHDTVLQKQLQRTPPPALATQVQSLDVPGGDTTKKKSAPGVGSAASTSKIDVAKIIPRLLFFIFSLLVLSILLKDKILRNMARGLDLTPQQEIQLGESMYKVLYKDLHVLKDPVLQKVLDEAGRRLSQDSTLAYAWVMIDDAKPAEIDILPGGIMLVPVKLLKKLKSLDELYGIMSSKMMIAEQHLVFEELVSVAGWDIYFPLLNRRYDLLALKLAPKARGIVYGHDTQLLADRLTFIRLWALNVDPMEWVHYLERQSNAQKRDKDPAQRQVSALTDARIQYIKEIDIRKPPGTFYVESTFDWEVVRDRLRMTGAKTCVRKENMEQQLKRLEEKIEGLRETEITSEYSIPDRFFVPLAIWPGQRDLRAIIFKVPQGVPMEFTLSHGAQSPSIPQRIIIADGFLKSQPLKILWDKQGRPFPNDYKDKVTSMTGYLTFLPLQAASDTLWLSTNTFSHIIQDGKIVIQYEDSPGQLSQPDLIIQVQGVEEASGEDLTKLIKEKKFNDLKSQMMICK
jgi:hypothetical protein